MPAVETKSIDRLLPPAASEAFDINLTSHAIDKLAAVARMHADIFRVYSPVRECDDYVVIRPDLVKHVLLHNRQGYGKGSAFGRVKLLLGNSIIASDGELWRRNRLMIQPAFHKQAVLCHTQRLMKMNGSLTERWCKLAAAGRPINITAETSQLALHNVLLSLFSVDLARFEGADGHNLLWMVHEYSARNLQFALKFRQLAGPVLELVRWRRDNAIPRDDILAMVMQNAHLQTAPPVADKQLVDEILMLIVAGHETTASALNFCWYLLSRHPLVQARMYDEMQRVLAGRDPQIADLAQLEYTRQVLEESMRLYPPGWAFSRKALADDCIGDFDVPKDTEILVAPYLTHRHPAHWNDPDRFDPDRFNPAARAARDRFAFLPFSAGPRRCIGDALAMLEMQLHLAMIVPRLAFNGIGADTETRPIEVEAEVNLRSRNPVVLSALLR